MSPSGFRGINIGEGFPHRLRDAPRSVDGPVCTTDFIWGGRRTEGRDRVCRQADPKIYLEMAETQSIKLPWEEDGSDGSPLPVVRAESKARVVKSKWLETNKQNAVQEQPSLWQRTERSPGTTFSLR